MIFFIISICIGVHLKGCLWSPRNAMMAQNAAIEQRHGCRALATDSDVRTHLSCSVFYRYYFSADI